MLCLSSEGISDKKQNNGGLKSMAHLLSQDGQHAERVHRASENLKSRDLLDRS